MTSVPSTDCSGKSSRAPDEAPTTKQWLQRLVRPLYLSRTGCLRYPHGILNSSYVGVMLKVISIGVDGGLLHKMDDFFGLSYLSTEWNDGQWQAVREDGPCALSPSELQALPWLFPEMTYYGDDTERAFLPIDESEMSDYRAREASELVGKVVIRTGRCQGDGSYMENALKILAVRPDGSLSVQDEEDLLDKSKSTLEPHWNDGKWAKVNPAQSPHGFFTNACELSDHPLPCKVIWSAIKSGAEEIRWRSTSHLHHQDPYGHLRDIVKEDEGCQVMIDMFADMLGGERCFMGQYDNRVINS